MAKKDEATIAVVSEPCFEKEQLVASKRFAQRRDLIASLLADGEKYTCSQVEAMISDFDNRIFEERKGE